LQPVTPALSPTRTQGAQNDDTDSAADEHRTSNLATLSGVPGQPSDSCRRTDWPTTDTGYDEVSHVRHGRRAVATVRCWRLVSVIARLVATRGLARYQAALEDTWWHEVRSGSQDRSACPQRPWLGHCEDPQGERGIPEEDSRRRRRLSKRLTSRSKTKRTSTSTTRPGGAGSCGSRPSARGPCCRHPSRRTSRPQSAPPEPRPSAPTW